MTRRAERVGDVLRAELSTIISRKASDPRVRMTSVSSVDLSPDLRHARVHVSVVGDLAAQEASLAALRHAAGYIRGHLGRELKRACCFRHHCLHLLQQRLLCLVRDRRRLVVVGVVICVDQFQQLGACALF